MIKNIYGHRGARGLYPENTMFGFINSLNHNLSGFEFDVVVSKDHQLIVSHEPWMSFKYCSHPEGKPITYINQKRYNIYKMTVEEIKRFDCGSKLNLHYPYQKLTPCYKPTLQELFDYLRTIDFKKLTLLIELKSRKTWFNTFQPPLKTYAQLVIDFFTHNQIDHQVVVKSFDHKLLNLIYKDLPQIEIGFLVDNKRSVKNNLKKLKFKPSYYNLKHQLITKNIVDELNMRHIKTIPWTVNTIKDGLRLESLGIDSIITDYPNLFTDSY